MTTVQRQTRGIIALTIGLAMIPFFFFYLPPDFFFSEPVFSKQTPQSLIIEVIAEKGETGIYFVPPDMPDKKYYIFGKGGGKRVADESETAFLGEVPLNIKMRENNDSGKPIVIADPEGNQAKVLKDITAKIVSQIRKRN